MQPIKTVRIKLETFPVSHTLWLPVLKRLVKPSASIQERMTVIWVCPICQVQVSVDDGMTVVGTPINTTRNTAARIDTRRAVADIY